MALRSSPALIPFLCSRIISASPSVALPPMPATVDVYAQAPTNVRFLLLVEETALALKILYKYF
jgi:hypothetical protein